MTTPILESAMAVVAARLTAQLSGVTVERARFGDVDTDNEALPRLLVTVADWSADETQEPLVVHYTLAFAVQGWCTVSRGTALAVQQAASTLHARVVAALSGWLPTESGLGGPAEEGVEFEPPSAENSTKPIGAFTARYSMLCLATIGDPYSS